MAQAAQARVLLVVRPCLAHYNLTAIHSRPADTMQTVVPTSVKNADRNGPPNLRGDQQVELR